MARPRQRTLPVIMRELQGYVDEREGELATVRAQLSGALQERDDLAGQLRKRDDEDTLVTVSS